MRARLLVFASIAALTIASCGGDEPAGDPQTNEQETPAGTNTVVVPSVTREGETETPEPEPDPPSADTVTIEPAFPGLDPMQGPTALVELPGEEIFLLLLQEGRVLSFADDADTPAYEEALDWRGQTGTRGLEEGLLGIAVSPDFESDGYVYLYYTAAEGQDRSVISRFSVTGSGADIRLDPESELVILDVPQPHANHNGGSMQFGPDGMLYIALGDGGDAGDPVGYAQDTGILLGSILRIDVSVSTEEQPYAIPPDNPFVDVDDADGEIFAYGFRNPWRISFDQETGDLWAGDVGQDAIEEVDLVETGGNYGWNIMEGFSCYNSDDCDQEGLELPVIDYEHAGQHCSVTGGYVARGPDAGTLEGWYVYADYCSGATWALPAAESDSRPEPVVLRESGPEISGFAEALDGRLFMLGFDGTIYRVTGES